MRAEITDMSPYSHTGRVHVKKVKATITGISDGEYIQDETRVKNMIVDSDLKGAYHYLRSGVSVAVQVETFLEAIDLFGPFDFLAVDFEKIHNQHLDGVFGLMCKEFIDEIKKRTGLKVLLYTRKTIIHEWLLPFNQYWYQDEDLWLAQYPYYGWNDVMKEVPVMPEKWNPSLPAGVTEWLFWQYSADGNGKSSEYGGEGNSSIDLNVFNGTLQEMLDWAEVMVVEPEPPVDPPTVVEPDCEKYITALTEIRDTANGVI